MELAETGPSAPLMSPTACPFTASTTSSCGWKRGAAAYFFSRVRIRGGRIQGPETGARDCVSRVVQQGGFGWS